jgi:hypothetical protein
MKWEADHALLNRAVTAHERSHPSADHTVPMATMMVL